MRCRLAGLRSVLVGSVRDSVPHFFSPKHSDGSGLPSVRRRVSARGR
jgi:hypothetical protein